MVWLWIIDSAVLAGLLIGADLHDTVKFHFFHFSAVLEVVVLVGSRIEQPLLDTLL